MARLAGDLCDGLRLHPLVTARYTREVVLPAIEAGAGRAGRRLSDIDVVGTPFIITGATKAEVEAAKPAVKQHIAFYASTRTYHAVLEHHGWREAGQQLHVLSIEGRWGEMGGLITDEMLAEFATTGTYDEIAPKLRERWGGVCSTVFLGLPPAARKDKRLTRAIVEALQQP
jgi:alkanesulfonate monooxygenase SsuD/methylene tetrahydromethanopterin reductase-like flavin-dependent oxidoreductase (luciferase family)